MRKPPPSFRVWQATPGIGGTGRSANGGVSRNCSPTDHAAAAPMIAFSRPEDRMWEWPEEMDGHKKGGRHFVFKTPAPFSRLGGMRSITLKTHLIVTIHIIL